MSSVSPSTLQIERLDPKKNISIFHKLPTDLIYLSLDYFLEDPKDIFAISKTCKVFYRCLEKAREIFKNYNDFIGTIFDSWKDVKRLPEQNVSFEKFDLTDLEYCFKHFLHPIMIGKTSNKNPFITFRYNIRDQEGKIINIVLSILTKTSNNNCWLKIIYFLKKDTPNRYLKDPIFHDMLVIIINNKTATANRIRRLIKREPIGEVLSEGVPNTQYLGGWTPPYIYRLYESSRKVTNQDKSIVELVDEIQKNEE